MRWGLKGADSQEDFESYSERTILGVNLKVSSRVRECEFLDEALALGKSVNVAFANANTLRVAKRFKNYRSLLQNFRVLNDGIGVDLASRIKFGRPFPENLNGSDFIPYYFSASRHDLRVFLLGARREVVAEAAHNFQRAFPRHTIVGQHDGYFRDDDNARLCRQIRESGANVLLVGMGNPLQEYWIAEHGDQSGAKLLFGVGALFDFMSGRVVRAPAWVQQARCEWIFRLCLEPRRLYKRYLLDGAVFLKDVCIDRAFGEASFPAKASDSFR